MPRLNNPTGISSRPTSVVLTELAVAAGIAGRSVTLCFDEYPASIVCEMYRYFIAGLDADNVMRVQRQGDVKELEKRISDTRLVLVQSPRLYTSTAWAVHMYMSSADEIAARPAIFCGFVPSDADDDPGPSLVLRGSSNELNSITRWISERNSAHSDSVEIQWPNHIQYDPLLDESHWHLPVGATPAPHYQLCRYQLLRSLVTGACLLRSVQQPSASHTSLNVTMEDYELVRRLLQSQITAPADAPHDRLATQMLSRANVYLKVKYGHDQELENPLRATAFEYECLERQKTRDRELITRRELADLGNVNSTTVRKLVEFLKTVSDGNDQFGKLGLVRRPPTKNEWRRLPPRSLIQLLRPWSTKQIRTHFDGLRRQGLITAERDHSNGPWRYELPEELSVNGSTFANLPSAQELEAQSDIANSS